MYTTKKDINVFLLIITLNTFKILWEKSHVHFFNVFTVKNSLRFYFSSLRGWYQLVSSPMSWLKPTISFLTDILLVSSHYFSSITLIKWWVVFLLFSPLKGLCFIIPVNISKWPNMSLLSYKRKGSTLVLVSWPTAHSNSWRKNNSSDFNSLAGISLKWLYGWYDKACL